MSEIESIEEFEEGIIYEYASCIEESHRENEKCRFRVDLDFSTEEKCPGSIDPTIQFQYLDGYVADIPRENVKRHIDRDNIRLYK